LKAFRNLRSLIVFRKIYQSAAAPCTNVGASIFSLKPFCNRKAFIFREFYSEWSARSRTPCTNVGANIFILKPCCLQEGFLVFKKVCFEYRQSEAAHYTSVGAGIFILTAFQGREDPSCFQEDFFE
jgi:hypothetical protein